MSPIGSVGRSVRGRRLPDAIPDSAILQQRWAEGSGTNLEDELGDNDGTRSGPTWTSDANLEGGWGLYFDGNDDVVEIDTMPELSTDQDFSVVITVEWDTIQSDEGVIWSHALGSDDRWEFGITDGEFGSRWTNDGSNFPSVSASVSRSTDEKTRVGISYDESRNEMEYHINGDNVTSGTNQTALSGEVAQRIGSRSSETNHISDVVMDHPIVYDKVLSEEEWAGDYNAQPWS